MRKVVICFLLLRSICFAADVEKQSVRRGGFFEFNEELDIYFRTQLNDSEVAALLHAPNNMFNIDIPSAYYGCLLSNANLKLPDDLKPQKLELRLSPDFIVVSNRMRIPGTKLQIKGAVMVLTNASLGAKRIEVELPEMKSLMEKLKMEPFFPNSPSPVTNVSLLPVREFQVID